MTKEEKIIESYGAAYESLHPYIDVNGWVRASNLKHHKGQLPFKINHIVMDGCDWYRPLELTGINDNHGWTKIEKESDLPDIHDVRMFMPCEFGKPRPDYSINSITIRNGFQAGVITHWRPIEMVPNPLY